MSLAEANDGRAANSLVELVADCHDDGLFIRDPSPAVVQSDRPGSIRIADTDLEKRSHGRIPFLALAQLWSLMHGVTPRRKILAGREYCARRGLSIDFETALRQHSESEVERCFHENREFKVVQAGGLVWHVRRSLFRDSHRAVLDDPDGFLAPGPKVMKHSRGTTIAETAGGAALKRFNLKKYRNLLKYQFAPSRARLAYRRAFHLEMLGIRSPRAIAFADRQVLGCLYRSYLLMEYVAEGSDIAHSLKTWSDEDRLRTRARALDEAGRLVGLLHDAGFANRDLKANNLLATSDGEIWLIDLDGLSLGERVREEVRVKNLRRMVRDLPRFGPITKRDALMFLRAYTRSIRRGTARDLYRKLSEEPWA